MRVNKVILVGVLFIILAGVIFLSNILNPIVHPVTHLFLMGSSKGKDIIFFGIMGLFLISSQIFRDRKVDSDRFLKISIVLGAIVLVAGIGLEVLFRYEMNIGLNTIFMTMENSISSTSILHTHLLKSIFGELVTHLIGPLIDKEINTGVGLYTYIPEIGKIIIFILPVLFITLLLSVRNKRFIQTFLLSFFASCLLIGALDGGLFATPAITGICGIYLIYTNGICIEKILDYIIKRKKIPEKCKIIPKYTGNLNFIIKLIKRYSPYIIAGFIIFLRFSIAFLGANIDYYEVNVTNPTENVTLNEFPIEKINYDTNKTTYIINSNYNEMELLNDLKIPLNNTCEYYTLSWNTFSYLDSTDPITQLLFELKETVDKIFHMLKLY